MTSIKIKLRKSSVKGNPGTIYYQVYHNKQYRFINTTMQLHPSQWNDKALLPRMKTTNDKYNQTIDSDIKNIYNIIEQLQSTCKPFTADDIVVRYKTSSTCTVLSFMNIQIEKLNSLQKYGTAKTYRSSLHSMQKFLNNQDITFMQFDESVVMRYNEWLEGRKIVRNSISFYMRVWRAVYNKAVRANITPQNYIFSNVYTGVERTNKRAVSGEVFAKLLHLNLSNKPSIALARDLFIFSYCTRGMAFVDIAYLKKTNIQNGYIIYRRRKTNQELAIRIEPCIQEIIDRYKEQTENSIYIFPMLKTTDELITKKKYYSALNYYNRKLKKLSAIAELNINLTSYTARHSWATIARKHNTPLSVISAGMGHTSERTTEIYLATILNEVIDSANLNVLSELKVDISY